MLNETATDKMYKIGDRDPNTGLMQLNTRLSFVLVPNNVILSIYLLLGCIGNITVIYVYNFRLKSKKDNRYFIPCLAVMDLFACIMASSFALSLNILPINFQGDVICKFLWFITEGITLSSGFMLLVIAVQRYLKVCKPFGSQMSLAWKRISMIIVVVLAAAIAGPVFVFYGEIRVFNKETNITGYRCGHFHHQDLNLKDGLIVYDFMLFSIAVTVVICITILYGFIGRKVYIQFKKDRERKKSTIVKHQENSNSFEHKNVSPLSPPVNTECWVYPVKHRSNSTASNSSDDCNSSEDPHNVPYSPPPTPSWTEQDEKKSRRSADLLKTYLPKIKKRHVKNHFAVFRYSYMFMLITLLFVVSYSPTVALMVREAIDPSFWTKLTNTEISLHLILYRMFIINHVVNPFIYGLFDGAFRREIKRVLCQCTIKSKITKS